LVDRRDLPEDIVGSDEVSRVPAREIHGVPPRMREVLIMRYRSGLAMGIPRARIELKRRLEKHHGERGVQTLTQKARSFFRCIPVAAVAEAIGGESEESRDAYVEDVCSVIRLLGCKPKARTMPE
jgi:hypothetical protein